MFFIELIDNLALLMALVVVFGFIGIRWGRFRDSAVLQGLVFGSVAVIGMLRSLQVEEGVHFDGRSVVISLCGLFFGPVAAAVSGGMALVLRIWQGGAGLPAGISVILASALLGAFFHARWSRQDRQLSSLQLLQFGLAVHVTMLLCLLLLPFEKVVVTLETLGPPVILIYPLATVLIGRILSEQMSRDRILTAQRESEERFAIFMENLPAAAFIKDADGRLLFGNRYLEQLFGFQGGNGKTTAELLPPEIAAQMAEDDRQVLAGGSRSMMETVRDTTGAVRIFQTFKFPVVASGRSPLLGGISFDITERRRMEDLLEFLSHAGSPGTRENFFEALARRLSSDLGMEFVCIDRLQGDGLMAVPLAVFHDGEFEDNVAYALKDTPCGDVVGKDACCFPTGVCHLFPQDRVLQEMGAESYVGTTLRGSDGKPIGLIAVIGKRPLADPHLAETILKQVAIRAAAELERQQIETALRESEERLRQLGDSLPGSYVYQYIHQADGAHRFIYLSTGVESVHGVRREDVLRDASLLHRQVDPAQLPALMAAEAEGLRSLVDLRMELRFLRPDGQWHWLQVNSRPRRNSDGMIVWNGVATDITGRKQAEEALSLSIGQYRLLAQNLPNTTVFLFDHDLRYTLVEGHLLPPLGFTKEQMVGKTLWEVLPRQRAERLALFYQAALAGEPQEDIASEYEGHHYLTNILPIKDSQGRILGGMVLSLEISERKLAEAALQKSQSLLAQAEKIGKAGGWEFDIETKKQIWTEMVYHIHEVDPGERPTVEQGLNFYTPASRPIVERVVQRAIEQGESFDEELEIVTAKGNLRSVHVIGKADLPNHKVFGFFQDITEHKRIEEALRQSEETFRSIVESSPTAIYFYRLDPDGRLILTGANPAADRIIGISHQALIGKTMEAAFPKLAGTAVPEMYRQVARKEIGPQSFEIPYKDNLIDGYYAVNIFRTGEMVIAVDFIDISDRKQTEADLRKSEERYHSLVMTAPILVAEVDREGKILFINRCSDGFAPATVIGTSSYDYLDEPGRQAFRNGLENVFASRVPQRFILQGLGDHEKMRWWETILGPVVIDGAVASAVQISFDITGRKQTEAELLKHQEHLAELVQERTAELAAARDLAQAANRAKSVFLANMSHELRTPLTAILGFAEILSRDPEIRGRSRDNLSIVMRSGEHLLALINDILDLSKIEAGRLEIDRRNVDMGELIGDVVNMMRVRAEAKRLRLILDQASGFPRFVNTDPGKFRQILVNLISNAIKFTSAGQITLRLAAEPAAAGHLLSIEVRDTGIGIKRDDLDRIFLPFEQTAGTAALTEGTGLGLTITRQYVEILGGKIVVESEPGKGSCFRFTIPVGRCDPDHARLPSCPDYPVRIAGPATVVRALIVEDQPENRLLLRHFLEPLDFQIREAANGQEALAVFQEWQPQVIFMDRRMPVLDGLEATRKIRTLSGGAETVIIAVSARSFKEEQQEMLAAGCNGFIAKPFGSGDIMALLKQHLHLEFVYEEK